MIRTEFFKPDQINLLPREVVSLYHPASPFLKLGAHPVTFEGFEAAITQKTFPDKHRSVLHKVLSAQYAVLPANKAVKASIQALLQPDTFTVTTGHQLCLAGGPLYFVIKIASVIRLAQQLAQQFPGKTFIPVYWAASEDHDFEEINHFFVGTEKFAYSSTHKGAVGRFPAAEALSALEQALAEVPGLQVSSLFADVKKAYAGSGTLSEAVRRMVHKWFGDSGLLCLDADNPELKQLFAPIMEKELNGFAQEKVNETNAVLQTLDAEPQIHAREINLFYLKDESRERIEKQADGNYLAGNMHISSEALFAELQQYPERFSPNVVLRPLYQECILPNIAYVGGPAELRYWLQLPGMFRAAGIPFPVLVARDNFLFLSGKSVQQIEKQGIALPDFWKPLPELKKNFVLKNEKDLLFAAEWKNAVHAEMQKAIAYYGQQGNSSARYIGAAEKKTEKILDRLYQRTMKDLALKHASELKKTERIREEIFPAGVFQERRQSVFENLGMLGDRPFERLTELCDPMNPGLTCVIYS